MKIAANNINILAYKPWSPNVDSVTSSRVRTLLVNNAACGARSKSAKPGIHRSVVSLAMFANG